MKLILILLFIVCLSTLVLASCNNDNSFLSSDNMTICFRSCTMQNISNMSQFVNCDSSTTCNLNIRNSSGYLILDNQLMSQDSTTFNYSMGLMGAYNQSMIGKGTCNFPYGRTEYIFLIEYLNPTVVQPSQGGSSSGSSQSGFVAYQTIGNITIDAASSWDLNQDNQVKIYVYDKQGSLTDAKSIFYTFEGSDNRIIVNGSGIRRVGSGQYVIDCSLMTSEAKINEIIPYTLKITATDSLYTLEKSKDIKTKSYNFITKSLAWIKTFSLGCWDKLVNYWYFIVPLAIIILILIFYLFLKKK